MKRRNLKKTRKWKVNHLHYSYYIIERDAIKHLYKALIANIKDAVYDLIVLLETILFFATIIISPWAYKYHKTQLTKFKETFNKNYGNYNIF
jgi:hypothetical protein